MQEIIFQVNIPIEVPEGAQILNVNFSVGEPYVTSEDIAAEQQQIERGLSPIIDNWTEMARIRQQQVQEEMFRQQQGMIYTRNRARKKEPEVREKVDWSKEGF